MRYAPTGTVLLLQFAAITASLLGMALWPPSSGALLLVPLLHQNVGSVAMLARASGAMLLDKGPLPASLVVIGDRARIARQDAAGDVLILAAWPAGCGDGSASEAVS